MQRTFRNHGNSSARRKSRAGKPYNRAKRRVLGFEALEPRRLLSAYNWQTVPIGGGGFVTGIIFSPTVPNLVYARTDVGGAYRWEQGSGKWMPLFDFLPYNDPVLLAGNGVESMAIDPNNADRVYAAVGIYTWQGQSAIFRSSDEGQTWQRTNLPFGLGGNQDGRSDGERLMVDPNDSSILFLGTNQNGLWKSTDYGVTWNQVTSFPVTTTNNGVGLNFVQFIKSSGTPGSATPTLYVGVSQTGNNLYRSNDGGATWQNVSNPALDPTQMPQHAALDADGSMYLTFGNTAGPGGMGNSNGTPDGSVWKLQTNTGAWTNVTPNTYGQGGFSGVSVDAEHPGTLVVTTMDRWWPADDIYRSTNGGATWTSLRNTDITPWAWTDGIQWDGGSGSIGWPGNIQIDPFNSNHAMVAYGGGIMGTFDLTNADSGQATQWGSFVNNLEEVGTTALVSPASGAPLITSAGDVGGYRFTDPSTTGTSYNIMNGSSWDIDYAENNPNLMVRCGDSTTDIAYSTDNGVSWSFFSSVPSGTITGGGHLALSADGSRVVWDPSGSAPLSYATWNGSSWSSWTTSSWSGSADVSPISDRVNPNYFYVLDGQNLYASSDGGATWTLKTSSAPQATWGAIKANYTAEGDLWIAGTGLWHSTDHGATWTQVASSTVTSPVAIGFGKAAPGKTYPAIYVGGNANGTTGVFRSDDGGTTWTTISDAQDQLVGGLAGDKNVYGRVYMASRGLLVGEIQATAPSVATAAAFSPVSGTTGSLSALGADDGGEANLTYTWRATNWPPGATRPTFSVNGTNAAKNTTVTFSQAGYYSFQVTIKDAQGHFISSSVGAAWNPAQVLTSVAVSPSNSSVAVGVTRQFTATAYDQFGQPMGIQPAFTWSVASGGGSINSSGLYTAPGAAGSATVQASSGAISGSAAVTISTLSTPTVATPAAALPGAVVGVATSLTVLGADVSCTEAGLTYTWSATGPASVSFTASGTNAAKFTEATFSKPGAYTIQVAIANGGGRSVTSTVIVPVSIGPFGGSDADIGSPSPAGSTSYEPSTDTYSVSGSGSDIGGTSDQFHFFSKSVTGDATIIARVASLQNTASYAKGGVMFRDSTAANANFVSVAVTRNWSLYFQWRGSSNWPTEIWSFSPPVWLKLVRSGNSFTAFYATTSGTPTASDWTQIGTSQTVAMNATALAGLAVTSHANGTLCTGGFSGVQIGQPTTTPTIATAAAAAPNPVSGTSAALSVRGADSGVGGEASLTYTWSASSVPTGGTVTFTANGTNAAKNTAATFSMPGVYSLMATITNLAGNSVTSTVSVTVIQTATTIAISPAGATVAPNGQKQFSATVYDQFGTVFTPSGIVWSSSKSSLGSINASTGLFTAGAVLQGMTTVAATVGTVSGSAAVNVTALPAPTAWYGLDSSTAAADLSGNGRTGTLVGCPSWTNGESGGAMTFNGASQYVTVPALNLNSNTVTISGWIKRNGTPSDYTGVVFYRNGSGTASGISLRSSGALTYNWNDNSSAYNWSSNLTVPNGVWTFVALVIASNKATMYMQPAGSAMQSAVNNVSNAAQAFSGVGYIGQDSGGGRFYNGSLDDVRIYNVSLSTTQITQLSDSYFPPTVGTPASASPGTVTGTTTALSVQGASSVNLPLTYTWSVIGVPPAPVTFSPNGTIPAKNTTATFSKAGTYTLGVTIVDTYGQFTTSSVSVTVNQTLTSIAVSPATIGLASHGSQTFSATAYDQFTTAMSSQPSFNWSAVSGNITAGVYTGPYASGSDTVTAAAGGKTGTAAVTITNAAPTVATAAAASPSPTTGTTATLSVLGADSDGGGEPNLTYTWSITSKPTGAADPIVSTNGSNAAKSTTATFSKAGSYSFLVTITDQGGLSTTSPFSVTVNQTPTSLSVQSGPLAADGTVTFTAAASDQFGDLLSPQPQFNWALSGGGALSAGGVFTPPYCSYYYNNNEATITATGGSLSGQKTIAYPGAAQLNASGSVSWSGASVWTSTSTSSVTAAPGIRGVTGDLANFATGAGGTVTLDNYTTPILAGITFADAGTYTIAAPPVTGGTLHLDSATGAATLNVEAAAAQTISAPLSLDSDVAIAVAASGSLTLAGRLSGNGHSLTVSGPGTVLLSGPGDNGIVSTRVTSGTLRIGNSSVLADGSSLTVGDAGAFSSPPVGAPAAAAPLATSTAAPLATPTSARLASPSAAPLTTPSAVFAPASSVARNLSPRAVAAVMVADPPMPKVLPWVRRSAAAIFSAVPGQEAQEQRSGVEDAGGLSLSGHTSRFFGLR